MMGFFYVDNFFFASNLYLRIFVKQLKNTIMKLLEIYNLYLTIQMKADDALEESFNLRCDKKISYEESEYNRLHWEGVKLGAETLYKKIQELNKESVSL
jgi:hypothetical protein